jgi:Fic family protein
MEVFTEVFMDFLDHFTISGRLLTSIAEIDEFKGRWAALGNLAPERLSALKRIATIESVGSSTRIEGVKLSDDEIDRLLSGLEIKSFRSRDEQEVSGYAALMELIFDSYKDLPLTENHIQQLHHILLKYSEKDDRHRGYYKKFPNHVEAFDESGQSLGVVFETATPFETPGLMKDLVNLTHHSLDNKIHHPLLAIANFIVRFLAIHPFQDGNGRLSRALTTLLLIQNGYLYVPYCSLERIIEDNKEEYYRTLRRAQTTLDSPESLIGDWISFFINCLLIQKNILVKKIDQERLTAALPPLSEKIMEVLKSRGKVTVKEAGALTGANRNTIKDHLKKLSDSGHIIQKGVGRGTWYEKK